MNDIIYLFIFFFSSRRRHTRFDCDWSSDVCSSDLHEHNAGEKVVIANCPTGDRQKRSRRKGGHFAHLPHADRKSTRLNSSHSQISYAVFCLKKKKLASWEHGA